MTIGTEGELVIMKYHQAENFDPGMTCIIYYAVCMIYHVYILNSRLQVFFNYGSRWALSELKCILGHFWPFSGEFLENSKIRFSQKAPKY